MNCSPHAHIIDSRFHGKGYATDEACRIFCDLRRYQRWLDVEAALALSQAELGIIPAAAAANIRENARIERLDLEGIRQGLRVTGHSLMPLLDALGRVCDPEAGQFIHYGATTQDIQDTAQVLEMREVIGLVERDLVAILRLLTGLARRYADLVTIGRSHGQQALPMTMGLKMAVWLDELWRGLERLDEMKGRVLVSQLFGGVGTMDALGERALDLLDGFSARLGLRPPRVAWHASRDRVAEYLSVLAILGGSLANIAEEIRSLSRSELGEMDEPFTLGKIGSSTMPHKRNPETCEQVVVLAGLIAAQVGPSLGGLINEHERDYRSIRLEWVTVTDASLYCCGALALMQQILTNPAVYEERVRKNVERAAPLISTEALMFFLGRSMGKQHAHALVYEVSMEMVAAGRPLLDLLMERPEIAGRFSRAEIEQAIRPENHVGLSRRLTLNTVEAVEAGLKERGEARPVEPDCPLRSDEGRCRHDKTS